jgi:hypothetical protein
MGEARKHWSWGVLAVLTIAACGGDDDSSGGVVTGLPSEQKLSTLSDEDVRNACQKVNDGAAAVITPMAVQRAVCMELAAAASVTYSSDGKETVDVDKCEQLVDTCLEGAAEQDQGDEEDEDEGVNDCDEANASGLKSCDATVGDYEACVNTILSEMQRVLSQLTCQNAEKLNSEEYSNQLDPAGIPQCQKIMTQCPDTTLGIPFAD